MRGKVRQRNGMREEMIKRGWGEKEEKKERKERINKKRSKVREKETIEKDGDKNSERVM